jgi:hypothetical protein
MRDNSVFKQNSQNLNNFVFVYIDAHRGGGEGAPHVPPSKDFEKLKHKNAIKHVNRGLPPRFSHNPMYPLKRI